MFEDSLLERRIARTRRRGFATVFSFFFEVILVGALIIVPMCFTEALPARELVTFLVAPAPPPPPPPPVASQPIQRATQKVISEVTDTGALRTPTRIPQKIEMIKEEAPPMVASTGGVVGGVPGGIPGGQLGGVIGGILRSAAVPNIPRRSVPKTVVVPKRIRVSQGVSAGLLIRKVVPKYPALARAARIQGAVVLSAIIGRDGTIQHLQLVSGQPLLAPAAINAVSQWLYRPYRLNKQPVEVETQITVHFTLAG